MLQQSAPPTTQPIVKKPRIQPETKGILWLLGLTLLWTYIFWIGYGFEIQRLAPSYQVSAKLDSWIDSVWNPLSILQWRWTNVVLLAVVASLIGEYGRDASQRKSTLNFRAALARGFYVFLITLTGQVVIAGGTGFLPHRPVGGGHQPVPTSTSAAPVSLRLADTVPSTGQVLPDETDVDAARYFRLVGAASFASFMASFFPGFFQKLSSQTQEKNGEGDGQSNRSDRLQHNEDGGAT